MPVDLASVSLSERLLAFYARHGFVPVVEDGAATEPDLPWVEDDDTDVPMIRHPRPPMAA